MTKDQNGLPSEGNKAKLLTFLKVLEEHTDENHTLRMTQLLEEMLARGCRVDRKFVYENIAALQAMGYKVDCINGGYGFYERKFELSELRLLSDAVQAARFISLSKSHRLLEKLKSLASLHQRKDLEQQLFISDRVKNQNEHTIYAIDNIHTAIRQNCMLSFHYFSYDLHKVRHPRRDGKLYHVSPYAMAWCDDNYYLICATLRHQNLSHYRIDRMGNTQVQADVPRTPFSHVSPYKDFFNTADYVKKHLSMFSGEVDTVTLRMENRLLDAVIDRFGTDIFIRPSDEGHFHARVEAAPTGAFFAWLSHFGPAAQVVSPESFRIKIKNQLSEMLENYSKDIKKECSHE